ncbi:hypothetical protein SPAR_38505 [Streptomyces sparsogenes DSM 40356]|uniref:Twin-arginine translocation signal domain-containing protein n=1 Tax=Streptomyces sparsogenes DSM 40356 TaxID=1331668 RepID=A0A1R1S753_9ACTN|nr:hypothetical protein SPAR_38505 [Streptomyces sparsogenes DSM 40356]
MDDEAGRQGHQPGLERRRFLGAVGAAGAAGVAMAGCDSSGHGEHDPTAHPSRAARRAVDTERHRPGNADWRIRSVGPRTRWRATPTR